MRRILTTIIFISLLAHPSFADRIKLQDGRVLTGHIKEETKDFVKLDFGIGVPLTYYRDQIKQMSKEDSAFQFPLDHGKHKDVVVEWWHFSGTLQSRNNENFGYEFVIFKFYLQKQGVNLYFGQLSVSDLQTSNLYFLENFNYTPSAELNSPGNIVTASNFSFDFSNPKIFYLKVKTDELSLEAALASQREIMIHGEKGNILMGAGTGSAYYSLTNMATEAKLKVSSTEYPGLLGRTWMDHQWGNFQLSDLFYDWFSIRLNDGRSLMAYCFRDRNDQIIKTIWTWGDEDGFPLKGEDLTILAKRNFAASQSNSNFPIEWTMTVPSLEATFEIKPFFDNQSTPYYWEGLSSVEGTIAGKKVSGNAYVQMTGYETSNKGDSFIKLFNNAFESFRKKAGKP